MGAEAERQQAAATVIQRAYRATRSAKLSMGRVTFEVTSNFET